MLSEDGSSHFVGNVEARDLMDGVADVVWRMGSRETLSWKTMEGTAFGILNQIVASNCH